MFVLIPKEGPDKELLSVRQEVETGLTDGKRTEVISGLVAGQSVSLPSWTAPEAVAVAANPFMPSFPKPPGGKRESANGEH